MVSDLCENCETSVQAQRISEHTLRTKIVMQAIIPIVGHANAITIGCLQGWFNTYKFRQNYPIAG
jgi:hypothetical protein